VSGVDGVGDVICVEGVSSDVGGVEWCRGGELCRVV
jgi:hypothetical protein